MGGRINSSSYARLSRLVTHLLLHSVRLRPRLIRLRLAMYLLLTSVRLTAGSNRNIDRMETYVFLLHFVDAYFVEFWVNTKHLFEGQTMF